MNVQLLLASNEPRTGFLNISPFADGSNPIMRRGDISNLDVIVDDAEVAELVALDVLDYLPSPDIGQSLDNWVGKLMHGGTIIVGGVDLREVARGLVSRQLTIDAANRLLYGDQSEPWAYRKATLTLQNLVELFRQRGLKVIHKRTVDYRYIVKAERP